VAVTGLGVATSLGCEVDAVWEALLAGRSGIGFIEQFDSRHFPVRIGGEVRALPSGDAFAAAQPNRTRRFAAWAAGRAWEDAGLPAPNGDAAGPANGQVHAVPFDPWRAAVFLGAGVQPVMEERLADDPFDGDRLSAARHLERCRRRPELLTQTDLAGVSGALSARFGLRGPSVTIQAACASANQAIGEAFLRIAEGRADLALAGGADSMITMVCVAGFDQLGALSRHPHPARASRPFDARRDGFVLGEGAAVLVLEELGQARRRGAAIRAELVGYGSTSDAYRFTDLAPAARGAAACMEAALRSAGLPPAVVDYVNAHGTATPQNDRLETQALRRVFGAHADRLAVSSTKSQLGHLTCAAGGIELVATVLALERGVLPPTINLEHPDPDCDLDYVPNEARPAAVAVALSNSFGFGGQNAALVARRWEGEA
jgi:3-oxoacyl-[acyl-carrier-protein] synthase II